MKFLRISLTMGMMIGLSLTLIVGQQKVERPDPAKQARDQIKQIDDSKSLRWNAAAIAKLANIEGDDVVPTLLKLYEAPPKEFPENMRYLVATSIRTRFSQPASIFAPKPMKASKSDIEHLRKFIKRSRKLHERSWAIHCFTGVLAKENDPEINLELFEIIGDDKIPAAIRSGILEGLSDAGDGTMFRVLEIMLKKEYDDSAEDSVMLETVVHAVARTYKPKFKPGKKLEDKWRPLFDKITEHLESEDLQPRTRREIARALQNCFGTKHAYPWKMMWDELFLTGKDPEDDTGKTYAKFMGMKIEGERILFLIDASDSMLNPLSDEEKKAVKGPTTGEKRSKAYEIDWSRVHNRFDAAREHLKWTLSRLPEETKVAVILFGATIEVLPATPTFIELKRKRRKSIYRSIDKVRPKKPSAKQQDARPHGVLLGETNYYRALLSAYRMGAQGIKDQPIEHNDPNLILGGADAIVLLSDGAPNRDGFSGDGPLESARSSQSFSSKQPGEGYWVDYPATPARPEREVTSRDPETGAITKRKIPATSGTAASRRWIKIITVKVRSYDSNGPYATATSVGLPAGFGARFAGAYLQNFEWELRRMNLQRRCRLYCVGIGEAAPAWLDVIAKIGGTKAAYFGPKQKKPIILPGGKLPELPRD